MSCFKKYGPGRVNVMPESTPGQAVTLDSQYDFRAQACTFGAMYRETLDNTAVRANRGANKPFEGAQSELSWSIDYIIPQGVSGASEGYKALLTGLGRSANGNMEPNAICNRSLQIARCDRDALLVEVMNGCIVSQAEFAFSTSDMPKVTFSGVARSKLELHGQELESALSVSAGQEDIDITPPHVIARYSYWMMGSNSSVHSAPIDGIKVIFTTPNGKINASLTALSEEEFSADFDTPIETSTTITGFYFDIPSAGTDSDIFVTTTSDWNLEKVDFPDNTNLPVSSCNVTIESGLSYGNLTTGQIVPSAILSGQSNITGSFSMYLDEEADDLMAADEVNLQLHTTSGGLMMPHCKLNEKPSYELSTSDAASGDFSFTAYSDVNEFNGLQIF